MEDAIRYPIGRFRFPENVEPGIVPRWIGELASAPSKLRELVTGLSDGQLDTPYREGGWTIRQVVHHLPDSLMNAYVRVRLALTQEHPTIVAYNEADWAELPDARRGGIQASLAIFDGVTERLVALFNSLSSADLERTYYHPGYQKDYRLVEVLALYAWHGHHHCAHISGLIEREG